MESASAVEPKTCPQCGKKLRADNTRGACSSCLSKAGASSLSPTKKKAKADTKKRFRIVAEALGADADALLEEFMSGWLENIRAKANLDDLPEDDA